jgi:teichuronic acid biosynthesis glycosyltransferase TuaG
MEMEDDLVSVITPAFKAERVIAETIRSVLQQTYSNWEMLIVDDCSPDATCIVVHEMQRSDERIRLFRNKQNGGPAAARNVALAQARGRWIAFLDSDDAWMPTKLAETLALAKEHGSALTFTGFRRTSSTGCEVGRYVSVPRRLSYYQLLGNTAIATSTVLIDRRLAGDFRMKDVFYDDFACWLELLRAGYFAYGLNKDLMRYRVQSESISRNKWRSALEVWRTYRKVEQIGLLRSVWSFFSYALRSVQKYRKF